MSSPRPSTPQRHRGAALRGSTWTRTGTRPGARSLAALLAGLLLPVAGATAAAAAPAPAVARPAGPPVTWLVQVAPGALPRARAAVLAAGGSVTRTLAALDALTVTLPAPALATVQAVPGVLSVEPDRQVRLHGGPEQVEGDPDSLSNVEKVTGTRGAWKGVVDDDTDSTSATPTSDTAKYRNLGQGVDIALIDSGVSPVPGLDDPSRIVNGPDLSFENGDPELAHRDTYGHGTHLAGILLGRDGTAPVDPKDTGSFVGMAPAARLVNVKVADAHGQSDVSQVLAAIDWVVEHRRAGGLDIRVLNLSFGTDSTQSYRVDPLAHAVEAAWASGIVVVTSAGNSGNADGRLTMPAADPYVLAVGATDSRGTKDKHDDVVPEFSSRGDGTRNPDLVAPGTSIPSLRVPGSWVDQTTSGGRVGTRFQRGSGTSQAAAVVSGAVAVLLSARPDLTPDQVKQLLVSTARRLPGAHAQAQGAGLLAVDRALLGDLKKDRAQRFPRSTGTGSLDASRGSARLLLQGVVLDGERDVFGRSYDAGSMASARDAGRTWDGGSWNGSVMTGDGFGLQGSTWAGSTWAGAAWQGSTWAGSTWAGSTWAAGHWTGSTWADSTWAGSTWAGSTWAGSTWAGSTWAGSTWASATWS